MVVLLSMFYFAFFFKFFLLVPIGNELRFGLRSYCFVSRVAIGPCPYLVCTSF